mgnify:CR=1
MHNGLYKCDTFFYLPQIALKSQNEQVLSFWVWMKGCFSSKIL